MDVKFRQKKSRLFTVIFYNNLFLLNLSKNNKIKRSLRLFEKNMQTAEMILEQTY